MTALQVLQVPQWLQMSQVASRTPSSRALSLTSEPLRHRLWRAHGHHALACAAGEVLAQRGAPIGTHRSVAWPRAGVGRPCSLVHGARACRRASCRAGRIAPPRRPACASLADSGADRRRPAAGPNRAPTPTRGAGLLAARASAREGRGRGVSTPGARRQACGRLDARGKLRVAARGAKNAEPGRRRLRKVDSCAVQVR